MQYCVVSIANEHYCYVKHCFSLPVVLFFWYCVILCVIIINAIVGNLFKFVRCATTAKNMEAIFYKIHQIIIIHVRELTYVKCYEFLILIYVHSTLYTCVHRHSRVYSFRMNVFNLFSKWICSCFVLIFT